MDEIVLLIDYDEIGDTFCFDGNLKEERTSEFIEEFLRMQIGKGEDNRKTNDESSTKIKSEKGDKKLCRLKKPNKNSKQFKLDKI